MPSDLLLAHKENDDLVESIYSSQGFLSDEDRLEAMFHIYENMNGSKDA